MKFISVAGPPVEEASTTMGNFPAPLAAAFTAARTSCRLASPFLPAGSLRGEAAATSCCSLDRVAVRTTRTFAAILSLRHSSSFTELMSRSMPPLGLATKSIAPSSSDFSVTSAPSFDSELTIRIGRGLLDMMISVAWRPSMCGMLMSMLITSGLSTSVCVTASRPSRASPHTSSWGSAAMMLCSTLRMNAESSTTSTRILLPACVIFKALLPSCRRRMLHLHACGRSNQLSYCSNKLVFLYRLGQEGRRAFLDGAVAMFGACARRDYHDRDISRLRVLPQVREQLVPICPRHFQVCHHKVATRLRDDLQCFQSVR